MSLTIKLALCQRVDKRSFTNVEMFLFRVGLVAPRAAEASSTSTSIST